MCVCVPPPPWVPRQIAAAAQNVLLLCSSCHQLPLLHACLLTSLYFEVWTPQSQTVHPPLSNCRAVLKTFSPSAQARTVHLVAQATSTVLDKVYMGQLSCVWVQAPRFFWSRRWAPPGIGCVRRPSSVRLCLRPPAVGLCPAVCVWPAGGGCAPPVTFKKNCPVDPQNTHTSPCP